MKIFLIFSILIVVFHISTSIGILKCVAKLAGSCRACKGAARNNNRIKSSEMKNSNRIASMSSPMESAQVRQNLTKAVIATTLSPIKESPQSSRSPTKSPKRKVAPTTQKQEEPNTTLKSASKRKPFYKGNNKFPSSDQRYLEYQFAVKMMGKTWGKDITDTWIARSQQEGLTNCQEALDSNLKFRNYRFDEHSQYDSSVPLKAKLRLWNGTTYDIVVTVCPFEIRPKLNKDVGSGGDEEYHKLGISAIPGHFYIFPFDQSTKFIVRDAEILDSSRLAAAMKKKVTLAMKFRNPAFCSQVEIIEEDSPLKVSLHGIMQYSVRSRLAR